MRKFLISCLVVSILYVSIKVCREYFVVKPFVPPEIFVPFQPEYGKPPIIDVIFGGATYKFIIDTGASDSVIGNVISTKTGVKTFHGFHLVKTAARWFTIMRQITLDEDPKIGNVVVKNIRWMELSKSDTEKLNGVFDGIIGRDILSSLVLHLDYANGFGSLMGEIAYRESHASMALYDSMILKKNSIITIGIDRKNKKFLVDTGGAYTMILCKKTPSLAWSNKSILKEVAIGITSIDCYPVGIIPFIEFGASSLSNIAARIKYDPFKSYYGMVGQYFLEEGDFYIDFLHNKLSYRINDKYLLSRESGSAIELDFVLPSISQMNSNIGSIRIVSIFPENQLVTKYGLKMGDKIIKINGKPLVVDSSDPTIDDISDYAYNLIFQRFDSLEVLRDDSRVTIRNDRQNGKLNGE